MVTVSIDEFCKVYLCRASKLEGSGFSFEIMQDRGDMILFVLKLLTSCYTH